MESMHRSSGQQIGGGGTAFCTAILDKYHYGKGTKNMRNPRTTSFALTLAAMLAAGGAVAQLPTTISFETPTYTVGNLAGQDTWTVDSGSASVTNSGAPSTNQPGGGAQFVTQADATSQISRNVSGTGSSRVLFSGWYYGTGSAALAAPASTDDIAVLLGFQSINANNFGIRKYEGGDFDAPNPDQSFSNSAWHNVVVNIRYSSGNQKTYDVKVDGTPVFANVPFVDNTVAQLNGFRSFSSTSASIDLLRFESSSAGNFDGDGMTDDQEMTTAGRNPFVADDPPAEIAVSYTGGNVPDGGGPINFGTVNQGDADPTVVFTVSNTGGTALTTSGMSVTGTGFSLTEGLSASIPAAGSDTFTVTMDTATAGSLTGNVSFANSDSDENPFNFSISGTVNSTGPVGPGTGYVGDTDGSRFVNASDFTATRNNIFDDYTCVDVDDCAGIGDGNRDNFVNASDFTSTRNNIFQDYTGLPIYCTTTTVCPPDEKPEAIASVAQLAPRGSNPTMTVSPNPASGSIGDSIVLTIAVDTAGNAARSVGTRITYNQSILTFVSAAVDSTVWNDQRINDGSTAGRVDLVGASTADRNGTLAFATVTFTAAANGSSAIDFSDNVNITNLNDANGTPIAGLVATDGAVNIAAAAPSMTLAPSTQTVNQGQGVSVQVNINALSNNIRSAGTRITYNQSILTFVSATVDSTVWNDQRINDGSTAGRVDLVGSSTADRTGNLVFATLNFTAAAAGSTALDFSDNVNITNINDANGTPIAGLVATDGSVTVQAVANNNPTVAITSPAGDSTVTNATNSLNISGTAADSDGTVASVVYTVNGGSEQTATGTTGWSFTANLNVGANTISVQSVDNLGARSTAATRTITRNPLPTVAITAPASNQTVPNATTSFNFAGTAADTNGTIASVQYTVNGGSVQTASGTTSWTFTATGLVVGANTISVTATDNTGDVSAPVVRTITRSAANQLPTVTILSPATDQTVPFSTSSIEITGTASDPAKSVGIVFYTINGGEAVEVEGTDDWFFTTNLSVGDNVIEVFAVDNEGAESARATRTICRSVGPLFSGDDLMVLTQFGDVWYAFLEPCGFTAPQRMRDTGFNQNIPGDRISLFGDLDDDGLTDVLTVTESGLNGPELWTAINQGNGTLGPSTFNSAGWAADKNPAVTQFAGADFNGDGMMDLIQLQNNSFTFAINTLGTLGAPTTISLPGLSVNSGVHIATGDVNGDGFEDIIHLDNTSGTVTVIKGSSTNPGTATPAPTVMLATSSLRYNPSAQQAIVIGDFNGDGNDDIAGISDVAPNVQVAITNGAGTSMAAPATWANQLGFHADPTRGLGWWVFATDVDNDGDDDLLQHTEFQTLWTSLSNGTNAFGTPFATAGLGYQHKPDGLWKIHPGNAIND